MGRSALEGLDRGKFERLWAAGVPTLAIAQKFGRKNGTWATRIASRLGLRSRQPRQRRDLDPTEVIAAREDGLTITDIAKELGCDPQQVRNCLDRMGMSAQSEDDPIHGLD